MMKVESERELTRSQFTNCTNCTNPRRECDLPFSGEGSLFGSRGRKAREHGRTCGATGVFPAEMCGSSVQSTRSRPLVVAGFAAHPQTVSRSGIPAHPPASAGWARMRSNTDTRTIRFVDLPILRENCTVNTRYRRTLGTPKMCARNGIEPETRESRYGHKGARNEGISKLCSQSSSTSSTMSVGKKP